MGENIVKPTCIKKYNTHMKGIDHVDQFLPCCFILRQAVKLTKEAGLHLITCGLFNFFSWYNVLNSRAKMKYKKFLLSVARDWVTGNINEGSQEIDTNLSSPSTGGTGRAPREDPQERLSGEMKWHEPVCIPASGKKAFPRRSCGICAAHGKKSASRCLSEFCFVPSSEEKAFCRVRPDVKKALGTFIAWLAVWVSAFVNKNVMLIDKQPPKCVWALIMMIR